MQKPNNYDNVTTSSDWTPVELGGHKLVIKAVKEQQSKTGKDMIVVAFDFDKNDSQPGYFSESFEKDIRPEKKWPNNGTKYIMVIDGRSGDTSKDFKSFITSVEASNKGFVTKWGDEFAGQFKGKKVGGIFGEVENEYNGKITMRRELRWFCSIDKTDGASIPAPKLLNNNKVIASANDPALTIIGDEEDIPF